METSSGEEFNFSYHKQIWFFIIGVKAKNCFSIIVCVVISAVLSLYLALLQLASAGACYRWHARRRRVHECVRSVVQALAIYLSRRTRHFARNGRNWIKNENKYPTERFSRIKWTKWRNLLEEPKELTETYWRNWLNQRSDQICKNR